MFLFLQEWFEGLFREVMHITFCLLPLGLWGWWGRGFLRTDNNGSSCNHRLCNITRFIWWVLHVILKNIPLRRWWLALQMEEIIHSPEKNPNILQAAARASEAWPQRKSASVELKLESHHIGQRFLNRWYLIETIVLPLNKEYSGIKWHTSVNLFSLLLVSELLSYLT